MLKVSLLGTCQATRLRVPLEATAGKLPKPDETWKPPGSRTDPEGLTRKAKIWTRKASSNFVHATIQLVPSQATAGSAPSPMRMSGWSMTTPSAFTRAAWTVLPSAVHATSQLVSPAETAGCLAVPMRIGETGISGPIVSPGASSWRPAAKVGVPAARRAVRASPSANSELFMFGSMEQLALRQYDKGGRKA